MLPDCSLELPMKGVKSSFQYSLRSSDWRLAASQAPRCQEQTTVDDDRTKGRQEGAGERQIQLHFNAITSEAPGRACHGGAMVGHLTPPQRST